MIWGLVMLLLALAFIVSGVALIRRVLDGRPVITVDDWGIRDRRAAVDAPWAEIERVWMWRQKLRTTHVDWIALDVRDPEKVRPSPAGTNRALKRVAEMMGAPAVILNAGDLSMPLGQLLAELVRRHAATRRG